MAGAVAIAGPVRVRPEPFAPFHPATRPWHLDGYWRFFLGRAFRTGQSATATTLASSVAASTIAMTVTSGTGIAVGDALLIFDASTSNPLKYQVLHVASVAGALIGINSGFKFDFAAGSTVQALWANDAHLTSWSALAQFISDARRSPSLGGTNLLGTIGDMSTSYTDANGKTSVPTGWESVGAATFITSAYAYAAGNIANARQGSGIHITPTAVGVGMKTLAAIPVTPGHQLQASIMAKAATAGSSFYLAAFDKTTGTELVRSVLTSRPEFGGQGGAQGLLTVRLTVPLGTTSLELRLLSTLTSGPVYFDDCRLIYSRQSSESDRFVIEYDPAGAVLLGDSWVVLGLGTLLPAALEARFGRAMPFTAKGVGGNRLDQMIARFYTDVLPYRPKYCIHGSGFANDLTGARTQAQVEADVDTFIDLCRSNGIVPVLLGAAPIESQIANSPVRADQIRARCDLAVGSLPLSSTAVPVDA